MSIALHYERSGIHQQRAGAWFRGHEYGQKREYRKFLPYEQIGDLIATKQSSWNIDTVFKGGNACPKFKIVRHELIHAVYFLRVKMKRLCESFDEAAPNYIRDMQLSGVYNTEVARGVFRDGRDTAITLTRENIREYLAPDRIENFTDLFAAPKRDLSGNFSDRELISALTAMKKYEQKPVLANQQLMVVVSSNMNFYPSVLNWPR